MKNLGNYWIELVLWNEFNFLKKKRITLKGSAEEEAVACTENNTFTITQVESSNTMLLLPDFIKDIKQVKT